MSLLPAIVRTDPMRLVRERWAFRFRFWGIRPPLCRFAIGVFWCATETDPSTGLPSEGKRPEQEMLP